MTHGVDAIAIEEYLVNPQCGGIGERALNDFAARRSRDFSVGFVSLGAGLLLSSSLFRHTLFANGAPKRNDMITTNFLKGDAMDAGFGFDDRCDRCSVKR